MSPHSVCIYYIVGVDDCASQPCQNGGICTNEVHGHRCSCEPGDTGDECQTSEHIYFVRLGVRSLANASRARQFNPLNPPGVGWVNLFFYFFKVSVSICTCVPNLGTVRRERFLTIYNPLNPPGVGWVKMFYFV